MRVTGASNTHLVTSPFVKTRLQVPVQNRKTFFYTLYKYFILKSYI